MQNGKATTEGDATKQARATATKAGDGPKPGADAPITADSPIGFGAHAWPTNETPGTLTMRNGSPTASNDVSLTAGPGGPILLEDTWLIEKNAHFNRERVPERVVHAKGAGAFGYFEVTNDMSKYTKAKMFNGVGKKTEMVARFSHVAIESGGADAYRDLRGFAMKFYTEDGNYDLVGNDTPIFFMRDPFKFPDFIHSQKRDPQTHLRDHAMQWDFWTLSPESIHQVLWLMGDRGIPAGYEYMNGYGSHTFMWKNEAGERFWIKYHLHSEQGVKNLTDDQAGQVRANEERLDSYTQSLFNRIDAGNVAAWKMSVQVMPYDEAFTYEYDPFDLTKVLLHKDYPLIPVGRMVLDRNPQNYFAEIESLAFSPANIVPGVYHSPDKMLQGRLFAYPDAHRYRIGSNYEKLPVNAAKNVDTYASNPYERDGVMATGDNGGTRVNYAPNSMGGAVPDAKYMEPALELHEATGRYAQTSRRNDDFVQATMFYNVIGKDGQARLEKTITTHMQSVPPPIRKRAVELFAKVDAGFGRRMAENLGVETRELAGATGD